MLKHLLPICAVGIVALAPGRAQTPIAGSDAQAILQRLDRLEAENRRLSAEVQDLRRQIAATVKDGDPADPPEQDSVTPAATEPERLQVEESRTAELDQKKVESTQKFPIALTGMLLVNAFANGTHAGGTNYPVVAGLGGSTATTGGTLRQTVLGLKFNGPRLIGGGKASGSLYFDFFGGANSPEDNVIRLRVATLDLTWNKTTLTFGQDKPIIAPREPVSLAQVGVSPLTAAGNLWDWEPQVKIEQRFDFSDNDSARLQAGVYQAEEGNTIVPPEVAATQEHYRPAYQARMEFSHTSGTKRFEIAPGYHASATHVFRQSVQSRVYSLDGLIRPASWIEMTGAWFIGKDVTGLGSLRQGYAVSPAGPIIPVHSQGGWAQLTITPASRWSFHLYSGEQNDRARDLNGSGISRNFVYAGNVMWKLAPNVIAAFEASQTRTTYISSGLRLNNHYDLALAYLF